jgi:hypothetical protein
MNARARRVATGSCIALACFLADAGAAGTARAAQLLDPTRPSGASDAGAQDAAGVHVQAIILREGTRVAIVSGHLVRAGDRIGSVLIEEVTPEGVRYLQNGHSVFARLAAGTVVVRRAPASGEHVP